MVRSFFRWAAPCAACAALLATLAAPQAVDAGGDAGDGCEARLHWAGERVTFSDPRGPTDLVVSATAGAEAVEVSTFRVTFWDGFRPRTARLRGITDDARRPQGRTVRFAPGESKRLHFAIQAPGPRVAYPFAVEGRSGQCVYSADVRAVHETPTAMRPFTPPDPLITAPRTCPADMVSIPGGTFVMGSDGLQDEERPAHPTAVSSFCMDRTEVTVAAYLPCVQSGECGSPGSSPSTFDDRVRYANHPITCVDLRNAASYCGSVGKRLPTEEEWEYAARGGDEQREYPWGAAPPTDQLCHQPTVADTRTDVPCAVGAFPGDRNRWGVLDLGGNVSEWTASAWSSDYASPRSVLWQPSGAPPGEVAGSFVVRGGSHHSSAIHAPNLPVRGTPRAAGRERAVAVTNFTNIGFRCVSDGVVAPARAPRRGR